MITAHVAVGLKYPPEAVKATVPVGEEPLTEAVQMVEEPPTRLDGSHVRAVVVDAAPVTTAKLADAEFPLASVIVTGYAAAETLGTTKLAESPPVEVVAVPESVSAAPPKVAVTEVEGAKPVPVIVIVPPCESPEGSKEIAGTTVKLALPTFSPSVAATVCDPAGEDGTVNVAVKEPEADVTREVGEVVSAVPSYVTDVIVEEVVNPVPVTVITSPTWPDVSLSVMRPVFTLTASESVAVAVLALASVTVRVTVKGDPAESVGVQVMEAEFEVEHPSGRFVHA